MGKHFPGFQRQVFRDFIQFVRGIDAEDESHASLVPAVQVFRLCEVGVATQRDLLEARLAAKFDGLVEVPSGVLVAGTVPRPIDDKQRFTRIGQRENQRVIAPLSLVADVHALLALARRFHHRAIGIDNRFLEERLRLHLPDLKPCGVEHVLQTIDVGRVKTAAEVARGGGIGDAACAQGVEVGLIATQKFQVLQACPSGEQVVGDIEHVVGLEIW